MEKINITVEKTTPVDGEFNVTLKAWHRGELFTQALHKPYTSQTWNDDEYRTFARDFERNVRSQFED